MSESKTATLSTLFHEPLKTYVTYDLLGRQEYVYQAPTDAIHGAPCFVTRYGYDVLGRQYKNKESIGVWDSSYEF